MKKKIKSIIDTLKENEITPEEFREVRFLEENQTIASEISLNRDFPDKSSVIVRFVLFQMQFQVMFGFFAEHKKTEERAVLAANVVFRETDKNRLVKVGNYYMVQGDEFTGDKMNEIFDASTRNFIHDVLATVENVVKKKVQEKTAKGE